MKQATLVIFLICCGGFLGCGGSELKRNQTAAETSNQVTDQSDPILFIENWVAENVLVVTGGSATIDSSSIIVERVLFDGKTYEAVVKIGQSNEASLISFEKKDAKWNFLSRKKVALDYGWPSR